ncbi:MAG: deoxyribose-phosphate aldolase [Pseudomonadota bacterium]
MDIASYIDHTALSPQTTPGDIEKLCMEARQYKFAAVCVNPLFVPVAVGSLQGSIVKVTTVAGFPLGAVTFETKVQETTQAIEQGATEIDMVMAIGPFKAGDHKAVAQDIAGVVRAAKGHTVKVIIETSLLNPDEIKNASQIAADNGATFVKTSTGFGSRGASIEDIKTMKDAVGDRCRIKASGGIRTREQAMAMIEAGASRIGTSAGVAIVKG